jgi:hypothetical protein
LNTSRLDRLAPLSGVMAVICLAAASAMVGVYDYLPTGDRLVSAFAQNAVGLVTAGFVGNLGAFLLLAFASCIAIRLRQAEPTEGWLVKFGFSGGTASGIVLGIGFSSLMATGSRAGASGGLGPSEALALYDFYSNLLGQLFGVTMAALILASSVIWLRSRMLPAWFNWVAIVVAVLMLTPFAYLMLILGLVWILVVSLWIYRGRPAAA